MESEYERQRAENIQRNERILAQLNIKPLQGRVSASLLSAPRASSRGAAADGAKQPTGARKRRHTDTGVDANGTVKASTPRRRSMRVRGLTPDGCQADDDVTAARARVKRERQQLDEEEDTPHRKLEDETLRAIARTDYGAREDDGKSADELSAALVARLQRIAMPFGDDNAETRADGAIAQCSAVRTAYGVNDNNDGDDSDARRTPQGAATRRCADMSKWTLDEERGFYKLTPDRSYSAAMLPLRHALVGALGDKWGRVGVFAANVAGRDDDDDDGGDGSLGGKGKCGDNESRAPPRTAMLTVDAHTRPVSALLARNHHQLVSASYDATVRCIDLQAERATTLMVDENDRNMFSSCVVDPSNEHVLYVSSVRGELCRVDMRQKRDQFDMFDVHDLKVFNVDVAPDRTDRLLLSTKNAGVFLLDARQLDDTPTASTPSRASSRHSERTREHSRQWQYARREGDLHRAVVHVLSHERAVCCARWSPVGQRVLTTCYDNYLRVWNASNDGGGTSSGAAPFVESAFVHNNNTGRWVKHFAAQWDPTTRHERFVCGSMNGAPHGIDVFDTQLSQRRETHRLGGEVMSAIAPVHAFHPDGSALMGGTGSGRAYVWTDW